AMIPALSTTAAAVVASIYLDRPPVAAGVDDGDELIVHQTRSDATSSEERATVSSEQSPDVDTSHIQWNRSDEGIELSGTVAPGTIVRLRKSDRNPLLNARGDPVSTVADDQGRWSVTLLDDTRLVAMFAFVLLGLAVLPILVGGKIYNTMQAVMTTKVLLVLGFCMIVGVTMVSPSNWMNVFSGFFKIGNVPVVAGEDANGNGVLDAGEDFDRDGRLDVVEPILEKDASGQVIKFDDRDGDGKWDGENVGNVFVSYFGEGEFPVLLLTQIALIGAFVGYAGGGGLSNSTYSNYVRDKGWGMGSQVGAIPSAVGGRKVTLSHIGKVFSLSDENLRKWKAWWRYVITDQVFIWAPGCVMGMALPALLSIEFSPHSEMFGQADRMEYAQAVITADGFRHAPGLSGGMRETMWIATLVVGLLVLLPSQMSITEDVCRRWTDIIWSGSRRVRESMQGHQVRRIYYSIMAVYVTWTFIGAYLFSTYGTPKVMVLVVANLNNIGLGFTAFLILRNNLKYLPEPLRPRMINRIGICFCGTLYLGMAGLVFYLKQVPILREMLGWG
ncbi:MAG: Nramp family divalent metal transporter, partial [Planctomycetaceae bacterium]